jgi:hypothetical protein
MFAVACVQKEKKASNNLWDYLCFIWNENVECRPRVILCFLLDEGRMERPKHVVGNQVNKSTVSECCVCVDLNSYPAIILHYA